MKNDKRKSRSKRRSLLATGIACLALFVTVATATYAWFSINTTVTVGVSSLEAVAGDNIDISSDGSNWGSSVSLTLDELNSTVTDISGDGKTFYNKAGQESTDYVEFKLQFRASSYYAIYLNNKSSVLPHTTDLSNKSTYGEYSKDYIAGAVRVAFLYKEPGSENEEVRLIWAPNSNYTLNPNTFALTVNDSDENINNKQYKYRKGPSESEIDIMNPENKGFLVTKSDSHTETEVKLYDNKNPLATIIPTTSGLMKEVEITVRIWLEGEDVECANPFLGGIFDTTLSFSAKALTQNSRPTVTVNPQGSPLVTGYSLGITGDNENAEYEISTDGKTYVPYTPDTLLDFVNKEVYVRERATTTGNSIPGSYTKVTVGRKGQAAPVKGDFDADAATRVLSSKNGYAPNALGATLEYSTDNVKFNPFTAHVTIGNNAKRTYYIRYAAYGDYDASDSVPVLMLGKETKPISAAISVYQNQGLVTVNAGLEYVIAASFAKAPEDDVINVSDGEQMEFTDQYIIAVRKTGDGVDTVDSDWAYYKLDNTAGTVTAVAGPAA